MQQGSFPCRFQEFHLVNQPYIFHLVYSIVKPFLSEKIRDRVIIRFKKKTTFISSPIYLHNFHCIYIDPRSRNRLKFTPSLPTTWDTPRIFGRK